MRARAIAEERDHGRARARLRSCATGRWLVFHASCLRHSGGEIGNTALIVGPANASEVAPIVADAYQLSTRAQPAQLGPLIEPGSFPRSVGRVEPYAALVRSTKSVIGPVRNSFGSPPASR